MIGYKLHILKQFYCWPFI